LLQTVEAIRPGRADVAELLVRANLRSGGSRTSPVSVSSRVSHRRSPGYSGALAQAHRAFVAGDLTAALQALDALNSEDAASLRDKIERFSEAYQNGSIEHHAKHAASAIRLLGMAKALEMQVSNGTSMLTETIDRQLADMYYVQGMQALSDGTLPQAYQAFRSAVGLVPDHSLSAHKLAELSQRAQQQFDAADKEADLQKARATLQAVLEIVPAESELYRKAKRRLDGMR
jgi:tetratricopeptide (TPR) repeat protein